jgi:hypothetical protein
MEFNRELWAMFLMNAVAIPATVYLLLANALHLGAYSRSVLATSLILGGLALAMWRWWKDGHSDADG